MKLIAYDKKTGEYVDSITTYDPQVEREFREDFKTCKVVKA